MGMDANTSPKRWSLDEIHELKKLYNELDNEQLEEHFNRTFLSIYKKARKIGLRKTPEMEFINRSRARIGAKSSSWKGGKKRNAKGYILVMTKGHPRADQFGYVMEHIVVAENQIGRFIGCDEVVHHINGIKDDNKIENLQVMGRGEHTILHHTGSKRSSETKKKISDKRKLQNKTKLEKESI